MSKGEKKSFGLPFLSVAFIVAVLSVTFFRAGRELWVFYTPNMKFIGGAPGLLIVGLVVIGVIASLIIIKLLNKENLLGRKLIRIPAIISFVLAGIFALGIIAILIFNGSQTNDVLFMYLRRDLPLVMIFLFVFLLVALILIKNDGLKKTLAIISTAAISLICLLRVFPSSSYKITSDPCVFDTGKDYSVVFATDKQGTGYVEYTYEGKEYKIFAQNNGRRITDRFIHSINVPYEHLDNNSYKVGGFRVIGDYSYGSKLGETAEKGPYKFRKNTSEKQKYLVVSDWHSYLKQAYSAISNIKDYDAVLLMGDPAAGMDFEEEAVKYIVEFGGSLSGGKMPVIYTRGNHETRGSFAPYLADYLGYDELYYTVDRGEYSFIILDSGEDKEDSHIEYGSLDDYYVNRVNMIDWLENIEVGNSKVIALSHAWQVSEPEPELSYIAFDAFTKLGVRFEISGHTHECRFLDGANEQEKEYLEKYPGITTYIDGGHSGKTYIASAITLDKDGVLFEAYDNSGNKVTDKKLNW